MRVLTLDQVFVVGGKMEERACRYANCVYLEDTKGFVIPVYTNADTREAFIRKPTEGVSKASIQEAWKFAIALGYKPCFEEDSYV